MRTLIFTTEVADLYKEVSEVIASVEINKKVVKRLTIKEMMQESFFHGATRFGDNFIA